MRKFITILSVMIITISMGVPAYADSYSRFSEDDEPNNTMNDAEYFKIDPEDDFIVINGIVSRDDEEDWFKVTSRKGSGESDIRLYSVDDDMNYSIYLYDENGDCLASSSKSRRYTDTIKNIFIRKDKIYFIKVEYAGGGYPTMPYELFFGINQ